MFCYQPEKSWGGQVIPGVYNSATEMMTQELWQQMVTSPQVAWLVSKHREVKASLDEVKWTSDEDFLEFARKMYAKRHTKAGKAFAACDTNAKRVALWCQDLKTRLPFVIFIATYPERVAKEGGQPARWRNQKFAELNGLVVLDVDHVDDPISKWREWSNNNIDLTAEGIMLVYVTPSGHGLKIVFRARWEWGNLIDNQLRMAEILGVKADTSCKDAARGAFLTTEKDILFIDRKIFTYENLDYAKKYNDGYRRGDSQPTLPFADDNTDAGVSATGSTCSKDVAAAGENSKAVDGNSESVAAVTYNGQSYQLDELIKSYYGDKQPGPADKGGNGKSRHTESLKWAYDLLVMTGRNKKLTEQLLRMIPWVHDIVSERGEDVEQTVSDADARVREREKKYGPSVQPSKDMRMAMGKLAKTVDEADEGLPLYEWGMQIEALMDSYPCLRESCHGLPVAGYPAGMFASAAFLGTLMTRTWYHFYHRPEDERRLNYCVLIIGDPASGKSFATRLHNILAAPIIVADRAGYDAVNRYKELRSTKGENKEKPKKPVVVIRDHPARTANGVFIADMNNAVEEVDGRPMHLHLLTFDSELDNATTMQRGGQWIDKSTMELKAFHNEEDGQAYANIDSVSGNFNVYWNYVYTGTPLSLAKKVTENNFGSGLATRLAVIPLPPSGFRMMALKKQSKIDLQADETLKTWAFRLDGVHGELPIWPLVEETWNWTNERMEIAAFNQDKADELLLKRVAYYGVCVAVPYILMRHWDEWVEKHTLTIDDTDVKLSRLVMDIQYRCQHHFFGGYAHAYFDNMMRDSQANRSRKSKYDLCYEQLSQDFTTEDVMRIYELKQNAAQAHISRLCKKGFLEKVGKSKYRKLKSSLI